ncbi:phage regulatory protein/antirepressor Ant [Comamonas aquatica]|uniref:phage antirepressor KilAC domain-containing protein n=1 Tax=Comamonas aquatica TaxID=225991 RepID=UPI00244768BC|nr:phage antirepressor KilAC domain-containing protein [Comamonas aquatica]MDH0898991.1 phage regulatory protein/antirepressor Ant [Comamonas aquatica]
MNQLTVAGGMPMTMSSREIAELASKRHDHVMVDCRKLADFYAETYSPEKSGQFVKSSTYTDSTGRELPCFELNKQACLDLVTGYSLPHRHAVNKRWQELEAQQAPALPANYLDALRAHLASEEKAAALAIEVQKKEQALVEAAPKVEFVERYVQASSGALGFRQVCKTLCLNEKWLAEFLELHQVMYRLAGKLTPYQQHIQAGRFEVKTGVSDSGYGYVQPKFTPKGVQWLAAEIAKHHAAKQMKALPA